jgi:hypothetical protein
VIISGLLASSTQILLNGVPRDYIFHRRGLCQGDLLSLMLFILVMNILSAGSMSVGGRAPSAPITYALEAPDFLVCGGCSKFFEAPSCWVVYKCLEEYCVTYQM